MAIKLLILQACLIAGEAVAEHAAVADTVEVTKEDADYLVRSGRALYLDKTNDPTKGLSTATKEDIDRARQQAKAIAASTEASAAANKPTDMAAIIANAVAQGVAAALAAKAPAA